MIKYLGSKKQLISKILYSINENINSAQSFLDVFSGTSRVGYAAKKQGLKVFSNDHNIYAYTIAQCYIEADKEKYEKLVQKLISELNMVPGKSGFFTNNYCVESRFFHPKNGEKVDAIRDKIESMSLEPIVKSILLVSLMEAADRIDSTCGIQMAYLKKWSKRSLGDLNLRVPVLLERSPFGSGKALCLEACDFVSNFSADIVYLDPPYNQHSYRNNYHIWETLVLWDSPEVYGLAKKRIDCKDKKSKFNSKTSFLASMSKLIDAITAKLIVVSFNNEGFINKPDMEDLLSKKGQVKTVEFDYKRYVGAQIGIYNPKGIEVGKIKKLTNKEFLYIVKCEK